VATFSVLRNLNPFISSIMSFCFFGDTTKLDAVWALVIILGGSIFYARHDLEIHFFGYIVCFIHITSMSAYSCFVKYQSRQLIPLEMSVLNNVMSIPIILSISFCLGELDIVSIQEFLARALGGGVATFWFLTSCILGCCISFTAFNCQTLISPTSFLTLNNLNKIPAILFSVVLFNGHMSLSMVAGMTTSLFGGYYFALVTMPGFDSKDAPRHRWRVLAFLLVCVSACSLVQFESTFAASYVKNAVIHKRKQTFFEFNFNALPLLFNNNSHPNASYFPSDSVQYSNHNAPDPVVDKNSANHVFVIDNSSHYIGDSTKIAPDAVVSKKVTDHITKNHSSKPILSSFRRPAMPEDADLRHAMQYISDFHLAPCSSSTPLFVVDGFYDWGLGNNLLCKFIPGFVPIRLEQARKYDLTIRGCFHDIQ
jgi:hypothetical protein